MPPGILGASLADYPHVFPPPGFVPFVRGNAITVASGAVNALEATSLVNIPLMATGWLIDFGIQISDTLLGSWTLYINGAAERDYTNVKASRGAPETPVKIYKKLAPQQTIQLGFSNTGLNGIAASYYMFGWYNLGS